MTGKLIIWGIQKLTTIKSERIFNFRVIKARDEINIRKPIFNFSKRGWFRWSIFCSVSHIYEKINHLKHSNFIL